jgi:subtilisin family serine protease
MLLLALFVLASGELAPLITHKTTIDRVCEGVEQRQHIIIFNHMAPTFGDKETLVNWAGIKGIKPCCVRHYFAIGKSFQGFSAFLSNVTLAEIRAQSIVDYVEEDERVSLDFTREPLLQGVTKVPADAAWQARFDWGQRRVNSRTWNLDTVPGALYNSRSPATYADGYAPASNWNWADNAYQLPSHGERAVIWIVDTGVYGDHDEFVIEVEGKRQSRVDLHVNFVDAPDNGTYDLNGHGTHCAGTAAGNFRGVAPGSVIRNVRVLGANGGGTWDGVIAGFSFVANNPKDGYISILSASLGGGATVSVDRAINEVVATGVVAVVAAGNSNNNACGTIVDGIHVGGNSPARAEQVISVAASDSSDTIASFSSYGPCTKSIAPGVNVVSAWPPAQGVDESDLYNNISGTSMATPHVAGAIAVHVSTPGEWTGVDDLKADLALDQTINVVKGLDGVKATTPNLFLYSQWKLQ